MTAECRNNLSLRKEKKGEGRGERKEGGREGEGREDHMAGWAPPLVKCGHTTKMSSQCVYKCLVTVHLVVGFK